MGAIVNASASFLLCAAIRFIHRKIKHDASQYKNGAQRPQQAGGMGIFNKYSVLDVVVIYLGDI